VGRTIAAAALARMTSHVLVGDPWHEEDADAASLGVSLMDPTRLIWVDVEGTAQDAEEVLRVLVRATRDLEGLDPQRAADGGAVPSRRPPKTKAFRQLRYPIQMWDLDRMAWSDVADPGVGARAPAASTS
jgi:hypothetical protein